MKGLAFCLFGDFKWPPTPDETLQSDGTATGCVAIGFDDHPDFPDEQWAAWMVWIPENKIGEMTPLSEEEPPSSDDRNLYQLEDAPKELQKDQPIKLWLHDPDGSNPTGEVLAFRGAFLLESFSASDSHNPQLRLPLAFNFDHLETNGFQSQLLVGHSSMQSFRLDIGIPSPIQQTNRDGWANKPVFPVGAFYLSAPNKIGEESVPDPRTLESIFLGSNKPKHNSKLKDVPIGEGRQIGHFGFTVSNPKAREDYASLKGIRNGGSKYRRWSRYFPVGEGFENFTSPVIDHLSNLGFSIKSKAENYSFLKVIKRRDATPENLNFSFVPIEDAEQSGVIARIRQRSREQDFHDGELDDVTFTKKSFRLNFESEIGRKIDTDSKSLLTECTVKWSKKAIVPSSIFKHWHKGNLSQLLQPEASAWLQWEQDVEPNIGVGYLTDKEVTDLESYALLDSAIRSMRAARHSLQQIEGAQPQSFFPEWELGSQKKNVRFAAYPQNLVAKFSLDTGIEWSNISNSNDVALRFRLSLADCPPREREAGNQDRYQISLRNWLPSIGEEIPSHAEHTHVLLTHDKLAVNALTDDLNFASFKLENDDNLNDQVARSSDVHDHANYTYLLGSLKFKRKRGFLASNGDRLDYSRLGVSRGLVRNELVGDHAVAVLAPLGIDLNLRLAVDFVLPISVDIPRGSRIDRPPPILITDSAQPEVGESNENFVLNIHEQTTMRGDWQMTATLLDDFARVVGQNNNKKSFVVISHEPFSLVRFFREPLGGQGDAESAIVAEYDSVSRSWQFRNTKSYRYTSQAQSIGEGADKPRRHEIHDPKIDDTSHRPYPLDKDGNARSDASYVIDYRLSPPADIWIEPTDLERGFALPEWSAHEIFRQRGAFGLGVRLQGLRAEFIYGLTSGVNTERESGAAQLARVAEIEALTGKILDIDITNNRYAPLDRRWRAVQKALRTRPERLEVWTLDAANKRPFAAARFTDGTTFALRSTALHRPPISAPGDPGHESLPLPSGTLSPRYHEQGLSGGALWPLESRNFFDRLLETPESVGGTIERLALSPLGGDADQTAGFLGGNLRVISQTRNGRVQRQRVEIMGRIAAFWHRAKHVVVYERTVNASAQFAPDIDPDNPDKDSTRTRRPVLRKVSEYVELLEPYRSYPDVEGVAAKTIGFLDSIRFNSNIINVDSAWSEDIDKNGWKVPLWNRYAARRRPKVYPRPDIGFTTVAEGEGDRPLVTQECLDPENIFFFAEATTNPDTDSWVSRLAIDYANVADAGDILKAINEKAPPQNPNQYDSPRATNASRILPGYRRFTWRLAPAGIKSRLNAERGDRPIYAGLESVSFMRAGLTPDNNSSATKEVIALVKESLEIDPSLGNKSPSLWLSGDEPQGIEKERKAYQEIVDAVVDAVNTGDGSIARAKYDIWHNNHIKTGANDLLLDKVFPLGGEIDNHLGDLQGKYTNLLNAGEKVEDQFGKIGSRCTALGSEAIGEVRLKRRLIAEDIRQFRETLDKSKFPDKSKIDWIDEWVNELQSRLDEILNPTRDDIGNVRTGIETIRAAIDDVETDIEDSLRRAQRRVDEMLASYDEAKPWSDARMDELFAKISSEFNGLWNDIYAAINEARQRFATELDDTAQRIGAVAARLLQEIAETKFAKLARLNRASASVRGALGKADSAVVESQEGLRKARKSIVSAQKKNPRPIYDSALVAITTAEASVVHADNLIDDITTRQAKITATLREAIPNIATTSARLVNDVKVALIDITDVLDALVEDGFEQSAAELRDLQEVLQAKLDDFEAWADEVSTAVIDYVRHIVSPMRDWFDAEFRSAITLASTINLVVMADLDRIAAQVQGQIEALQAALGESPSLVAQAVGRTVFRPALESVLTPITDTDLNDVHDGHQRVLNAFDSLAEDAEEKLAKLEDTALDALEDLNKICQTISSGVKDVRKYLERGLQDYRDELEQEIFGNESLSRLKAAIDAVTSDAKDIETALRELRYLDAKVTSLYNDAVATAEYGRIYTDRVLDQAGKLTDGGLGAAPNNILRLYSAATSAPELAMLKSNIDRMRTTFREAEDFLRSSKAKALLGRLGDTLKAMGLDLPFDELGDQFRIDNKALEKLELSKMFRNFGGMKLNGLFDGVKLPGDVQQFIDRYIKVSHDFDRKAVRAWVQVDVDVPIRGSRTLFEIGPFKANLKNSILNGRLKLEASKDAERVQESGNALVATQIEMEVAGQKMVTLEKVALRFSKEGGMEFEFDPKRIKLNSAFQFIQDTLGQLFPDEFGGVQIVKQNGIPVGLEHVFTMPPTSLTFGTSGVSNIVIANHFKLLAYPDFIISNRFNLSRSELPFVFSIFIIGGTGYIQIDAEYRPFDKRLSVMVEAAAGGSAALAFAIGPVAGGVYITLSVALSYRKVIGAPGGGLSVGVVLVIAGNVSLWGMVTILLTLMLRMTYRDDGRIDGLGSLSVEVRVSRFFKLKFRTQVTYKLRGGRTVRTVESNTETEIDPELQKKAARLKALRKKL